MLKNVKYFVVKPQDPVKPKTLENSSVDGQRSQCRTTHKRQDC